MIEELATIYNYENYLADLGKEKNSLLLEMESYAKKNHVPIMGSQAIETFIGLLSLQKPRCILEIGSAIGYSAIRMAHAFPNASITTIERDSERFHKAVEYIEASEMSQRIEIIEADALELSIDTHLKKPYDALFIDAAKGQYKRFFEKYSPLVIPGGVIYCDNMFMHGMVLQEDKDVPRRKRTMIRNLKEFTSWVMAHPSFDTFLLPVGDGILIAIKKEA
ncbi:O-methyltransferase [Sporosarcina pasteurii]|uniref:tRNA 5-hydroxyuridine methyltransferase n=1 Tax=Sporosarcina pasteurii TaxID=1474 RepID=A0A380BN16_SPOPA|nr:O-methyltransferase [Sporosarcina pasteurii]MDS9470988.1 O-methyltransferase [Sporosarcina pasteurii]QBQ05362.1 O-methyltransferase [Sporosarcina pasteurii]SUJ03609.1 cobalt-precorrin-6Y C(15)-methyltransferase [Sporosarcina pasteurii]